jgi:hypothetical protein
MLLRLCPIALLASASMHAQTQPAGRAFPETKWPVIVSGEIGTQQSLGYQPLHVAVGVGLEKPIGKWMEIDPGVSWSPDHAVLTHDGNSINFRANGIMWSGLGRTFGIAGGFGYTHLWTSQFSQSGFTPSLGMAARLHPWSVASRLYLTYVVPYNGYDVRTGLENSRSQGLLVYFEGQVATRVRAGLQLAAYHFSGQAKNPACNPSSPCYRTPACAASRATHWGAAAVLVIRLTPRQSTWEPY